jgi:hypothetical protein
MKESISDIAKFSLKEEFPLFENVNVKGENNVFRNYKYGESGVIYYVTLIIDFKTYLMEGYLEKWQDIKELVLDTIKMVGIKNEIKVLINFSDENK